MSKQRRGLPPLFLSFLLVSMSPAEDQGFGKNPCQLTCSECEGGTTVPCKSCKGKGYRRSSCSKCWNAKRRRSTGKLDCKRCERGRRDCYQCKGKGYHVTQKLGLGGGIVKKMVGCKSCRSRGWKPCRYCETGRRGCPTCKSRSYIDERCSTCKGTKLGECTSCLGVGKVDAPPLSPESSGRLKSVWKDALELQEMLDAGTEKLLSMERAIARFQAAKDRVAFTFRHVVSAKKTKDWSQDLRELQAEVKRSWKRDQKQLAVNVRNFGVLGRKMREGSEELARIIETAEWAGRALQKYHGANEGSLLPELRSRERVLGRDQRTVLRRVEAVSELEFKQRELNDVFRGTRDHLRELDVELQLYADKLLVLENERRENQESYERFEKQAVAIVEELGMSRQIRFHQSDTEPPNSDSLTVDARYNRRSSRGMNGDRLEEFVTRVFSVNEDLDRLRLIVSSSLVQPEHRGGEYLAGRGAMTLNLVRDDVTSEQRSRFFIGLPPRDPSPTSQTFLAEILLGYVMPWLFVVGMIVLGLRHFLRRRSSESEEVIPINVSLLEDSDTPFDCST